MGRKVDSWQSFALIGLGFPSGFNLDFFQGGIFLFVEWVLAGLKWSKESLYLYSIIWFIGDYWLKQIWDIFGCYCSFVAEIIRIWDFFVEKDLTAAFLPK